MPTLKKPLLNGFNPDPSIRRVGADYYIATSTFEWFPGVQIHHSRDLVNWRRLGRALDRVSQLDLRGCPNSGGVWAPCLTHADGRFWLLYTNVRHHPMVVVIDTPNQLGTADRIDGPWSEPVYQATLYFTHGGGLVAKAGPLTGFSIAGNDQKFVFADARIEGDTVVISSNQVPKPVVVRYGWADLPKATLFNQAELPASPFRTDDWPVTRRQP
jgi:hypothetical protein